VFFFSITGLRPAQPIHSSSTPIPSHSRVCLLAVRSHSQAKTTKKVTLRLECVECKYRTQKALKRCKHFELGGDKKRKVCWVSTLLRLRSPSTPPTHVLTLRHPYPLHRVLSSSKLSGFCFCMVVVRGPAWFSVGYRLAETAPAAFWLLNEKAARGAGLLLLANTGDFAFSCGAVGRQGLGTSVKLKPFIYPLQKARLCGLSCQ
jgi:hypothetical protein